MKFLFYALVVFCSTVTGNAQEAKAYQFYNQKQKPVSFAKVVDVLKKYDIVLFGEHHNNSINHWLQLQLTKALHKKAGNKLVLGAEMFERDNQAVLNLYLNGKLTYKELSEQARLWTNNKTDYQPLVDFAKDNKLVFVAGNVPRRYASIVAKQGLDSLRTIHVDEKAWMAKFPFPLDYEAPGYPEMLKMMGDHAGTKAKQFVAAQAIKDATMAESILNNYTKGQLFIHFHGDYHSKNYGGIYWYLTKFRPELKIAVIEVVESERFDLAYDSAKIEGFLPTEFILVLPDDMTKTY